MSSSRVWGRAVTPPTPASVPPLSEARADAAVRERDQAETRLKEAEARVRNAELQAAAASRIKVTAQ
jgi:hypothetical protein